MTPDELPPSAVVCADVVVVAPLAAAILSIICDTLPRRLCGTRELLLTSALVVGVVGLGGRADLGRKKKSSVSST